MIRHERTSDPSASARHRIAWERIDVENILTREAIERAFDLMALKGGDRGICMEIAVYGGSCLILASDMREASGDVDAVYLTDARQVNEIVDEVGRELSLPKEWMNQAVRRMAPPIGNPDPPLKPYGDYPRDTGHPVGLRVFLPSPEYMLAMKLLANRDGTLDASKVQTDQEDSVKLMRLTMINTTAKMSELMRQCYPQLPGLFAPALNPRIAAKMETLLDAYRTTDFGAEPRWNARRGGRGGIAD